MGQVTSYSTPIPSRDSRIEQPNINHPEDVRLCALILFPSLDQEPSPSPGTFNTQSPIIALVSDPSVSFLLASLNPAENLLDDQPQGVRTGGFSRIQLANVNAPCLRALGRKSGHVRIIPAGPLHTQAGGPPVCQPTEYLLLGGDPGESRWSRTVQR